MSSTLNSPSNLTHSTTSKSLLNNMAVRPASFSTQDTWYHIPSTLVNKSTISKRKLSEENKPNGKTRVRQSLIFMTSFEVSSCQVVENGRILLGPLSHLLMGNVSFVQIYAGKVLSNSKDGMKWQWCFEGVVGVSTQFFCRSSSPSYAFPIMVLAVQSMSSLPCSRAAYVYQNHMAGTTV